LFRSEKNTDQHLKSELRKSENRERIAQYKLERLKSRFDKLSEDLDLCQDALRTSQEQCECLQQQAHQTQTEHERARQEALMWRTQLFERMELLEDTHQQLNAVEEELQVAWEKAGQATVNHQTSHQELQKRDREKMAFEIKIDELQRSQRESHQAAADLLSALTDAEGAIASLQRSNDMYQREADSLKSIGASLTEKLNRVTEQRDRSREKSSALEGELNFERSRSEFLERELEQLRTELFETKAQLVTHELEAEVREIRKAGGDKQVRAKETKYADFPVTESRVLVSRGRSILSRATKRMSGWFRLDDSLN
jgi:predicted  nucleic acid-binding Zn-ribbon protein